MRITNATLIDKFCKKHKDAEVALAKWVEFVESVNWKNHAELKNDYLSADFVGNNRYVFNIRGNNYRLVVMVVFFAGTADTIRYSDFRRNILFLRRGRGYI
jgi:mRNA interferase HigB